MMDFTSDAITHEDEDRYDARYVQQASPVCYPSLYTALSTRIQQFTVEFLFVDGDKPHVRFKLNFDHPVDGTYASAVVSMDLTESLQDEYNQGVLLIMLRTYTDPTRAARAAFEFEIGHDFTLGEVLDAIAGRHSSLPNHFRFDLAQFCFVVAPDAGGNFDGCRDWIAQAFLRLHSLGWVGWQITRVFCPSLLGLANGSHLLSPGLLPRPFRPLSRPIDWSSAGFHDVIGKNFNGLLTATDMHHRGVDHRIIYTDLPMECGVFLAPWAQRFGFDYRRVHQLPYKVPEPPQPAIVAGDTGSTGNGGGGGGGVFNDDTE